MRAHPDRHKHKKDTFDALHRNKRRRDIVPSTITKDSKMPYGKYKGEIMGTLSVEWKKSHLSWLRTIARIPQSKMAKVYDYLKELEFNDWKE